MSVNEADAANIRDLAESVSELDQLMAEHLHLDELEASFLKALTAYAGVVEDSAEFLEAETRDRAEDILRHARLEAENIRMQADVYAAHVRAKADIYEESALRSAARIQAETRHESDSDGRTPSVTTGSRTGTRRPVGGAPVGRKVNGRPAMPAPSELDDEPSAILPILPYEDDDLEVADSDGSDPNAS